MVVIDSYEELLSLAHKERKILVYGAGKIATEMIKALPADGKYGIEGILVTNLPGNRKELFGIPVQGIEESVFDTETQVIIAVGGIEAQQEIRQVLKVHSYRKIATISARLEQEFNRNIAVTGLAARHKRDRAELENCMKRIIPRTRLKVLVVNICDHCNLNCRGCDHFSPIAEKRFVSVDKLEKDLMCIKDILGENIGIISVMGGEPLLHPDLVTILDRIRELFPSTAIWLSTNGLLLLNQEDSFWECCRANHVVMNVTKYPVGFDYDKAERIAKEYRGVEYRYYNRGNVEKTMGHYPLDVRGGQDSTDSFMHCFHANNECNMLSEGRLYTCTIAPNIPIFNKRYGTDIPLTEDDGIDIYSISGGQRELFERLSRPMPICRFCDVRHRTCGHDWGQSEGKMEEWT